MGLKSKKKAKKSGKKDKNKKKKANWRRLGTIWQGDKFQNFAIEKEPAGQLIWHDKEKNKYFEVKQASVFEPHENAPEKVVCNLSIDLGNEYHVEALDEGSEDEDEDEEDEDED